MHYGAYDARRNVFSQAEIMCLNNNTMQAKTYLKPPIYSYHLLMGFTHGDLLFTWEFPCSETPRGSFISWKMLCHGAESGVVFREPMKGFKYLVWTETLQTRRQLREHDASRSIKLANTSVSKPMKINTRIFWPLRDTIGTFGLLC